MTEPRIWTLKASPKDGRIWSPGKPPDDWVDLLVVEAQPVAELLERLLKHYSVIGQSPPLDDAHALLAALRKHESRPS